MPLVSIAVCQLRPLQLYLASIWRPACDPLFALVPVSAAIKAHLHWWSYERLFQGVPLQYPSPCLQLYTDASLSGWGAHLGDQVVQGTWDASTARLHINNLELHAVFLALQHFSCRAHGVNGLGLSGRLMRYDLRMVPVRILFKYGMHIVGCLANHPY